MSDDLIRQLRDRPADPKRWARWYRAAYPKVYYVAFRLAMGNVETARDLAQEAFARFLGYRAIERVENDEHALAFLIRTCRNLAADRATHTQRMPLAPLEESESLAESGSSIESKLDFEKVLREAKPEERQLLQWVGDGLSVAEIARHLGVTYTAAGVRLHRLKKRLQRDYGYTGL